MNSDKRWLTICSEGYYSCIMQFVSLEIVRSKDPWIRKSIEKYFIHKFYPNLNTLITSNPLSSLFVVQLQKNWFNSFLFCFIVLRFCFQSNHLNIWFSYTFNNIEQCILLYICVRSVSVWSLMKRCVYDKTR